jgi:steroid 5-alpha reductase family enzyme
VADQRRHARCSIVDIYWGFGFVIVAWSTYFVADGSDARGVLLVALTTIWGLRLSGYLAWRNLGKGEDYRYQAMRRKWGPNFWIISLGTVFLFQGVMMWIVSMPVQAGQVPATPEDLIWLDYVGIALFAIGLFFETVGDFQLAHFKADPVNKGKVMDRGLWRYTRHPNYFGDFMVWWGLHAVALATGEAWWSIVGPLLISFLLLRVSGGGMLEKTISKRRPGYEEYIRETSAFFPRPPKA